MKWLLIFEKRADEKVEIQKMFRTSNKEVYSFSDSLSASRAFTFLCISNWRELSYFLNLTPLHVEEIINHPNYKEFKIPKKIGKPRLICQPKDELMKIQRKLNLYLQSIYELHIPSCVHGFVPKSKTLHRSIVSNAQPHVGKSNILTIDLKDYFTSIRSKRVKKLFISWGINEEVSTALALLCTYKGCLPIGAPTSPVLANLCSYELDLKLMHFCEQNQLGYTRYADDLTFSSAGRISDGDVHSIIQFIEEANFTANRKKIRQIGSHRKQKITGVVVNKKLSVDRKLKKKIRAIEYDIQKNGLVVASKKHFGLDYTSRNEDGQKLIYKIQGLKSFVKMVEK
jgi:RNA-directed DNA polymerase